MEYKIIIRSEKIFSKDCSKIPQNILSIIFSKIEYLWLNWLNNSQIKKLNHYDLCDYKLRVWDYRILFNLDEKANEIVIFRILHRSKLY